MFKTLGFAVVFLLGTGVQLHANESDLQRIADVLDVSTIKTFQFTANGRMYALGQSTSPMAPWPRFYVKSLIRRYDFTAGAMREELVRIQGEDPPSGGAGQPLAGEQRSIALVNGDRAWNESGKNMVPQPHQASGRAHELAISPHGLVRAAFANNAAVGKKMIDGRQMTVISFNDPGEAPDRGLRQRSGRHRMD